MKPSKDLMATFDLPETLRFTPVAASRSVLSLTLKSSEEESTSLHSKFRTRHNIDIRKSGTKEYVAVLNPRGRRVALLEFNVYPSSDRIFLGEDRNGRLGSWWKQSIPNHIYKRDLLGSFQDDQGKSFCWTLKTPKTRGSGPSIAILTSIDSKVELAQLDVDEMELHLPHPIPEGVLDACIISAMIVFKALSRRRITLEIALSDSDNSDRGW